MLLIDDITDLEKLDRIYSPTIVVDELSELFLNPSVLSRKYSRSANFWYRLKSIILVS